MALANWKGPNHGPPVGTLYEVNRKFQGSYQSLHDLTRRVCGVSYHTGFV